MRSSGSCGSTGATYSVRHRHGRARPQDAADRRARRAHAAGARRPHRGAVRRDGRSARTRAPTTSCAPREQRHKRASQAIWERMQANGDIYLSKYSGWYSVRDEAYFDEDELTDGPDGASSRPAARPPNGSRRKAISSSLSAYAERLLAHYEAHPDFVTPEKYRNEIVAFVKRGLVRSLDQPHDLRLGRAGARRSAACHVCLGRRADQLHHRDRLSRRADRAGRSGPRTRMSSARTSRASMPSIGRPF